MSEPLPAPAQDPRHDRGFTLVEVIVAIVVLAFGLIAITNLFVLATSSNVVARQLTASAAQASDAMERLKAISFAGLVSGGASDNNALNQGAAAAHQWTEDQPIQVDTDGDRTVDNWEADRAVAGVGVIRIRWQIVRIDAQTRLIRVVAASANPALRGRTRAELVAFRSCTAPNLGCPATP